MSKLGDLKIGPPNIIIYGAAGTGKTALALTLGKYAQVLDLGGGLRTGITLKDKFQEARMQVDVKSCRETDPRRAMGFDKCLSYLNSIYDQQVKGTWPFKALIIDDFTMLAQFAVRRVLAMSNRLNKPPQIQEWGLAFINIEEALTLLYAMKCVVIMTAHRMPHEVDDRPQWGIACPGQKLPDKVPAYFDEVWVSHIKMVGQRGREFMIQSIGTAGVMARTRSSFPDDTNMNLGMVELLKLTGYDITKEEKKEENRPFLVKELAELADITLQAMKKGGGNAIK